MALRVKICCIQNQTEAELALKYEADAIGLVSHMPSGPGVITEEQIARIASNAPPTVGTFLLTCNQDAFEIIAQQKRCRTNTIQFVDQLDSDTYNHIRGALPGISIIQVIHVNGQKSLAEAKNIAPFVDALLLDSGHPDARVKELGGTGRTHDWRMSCKIVKSVDVPVFLAGGLTPENVKNAVKKVNPFGIDVCTGVRSNGHLDEEKLAKFISAIRDI